MAEFKAVIDRMKKSQSDGGGSEESLREQIALALEAQTIAFENGTNRQKKQVIQMTNDLKKQIAGDSLQLSDELKQQYSNMLSASTEVTQQGGMMSQIMSDAVGSIKSVIPNPMNLVRAIVDSNPIIRGGVGFLSTMIGYQRDAQREQQSLRDDQARAAKEQLDLLRAQADGDSDDPMTQLVKVNEEQLDILKRIDVGSEQTAKGVARIHGEMAESEVDDAFARSRELEANRENKASAINQEEEREEEQRSGAAFDLRGFLGNVGRRLGKIIKPILAVLGAIFSVKLLATLTTVAVAVGKFLVPLALFAGAITAFISGVDNASEILGKAEGDLTAVDRIVAGLANVIKFPLRLFDWVAEKLFGIQTDFEGRFMNWVRENNQMVTDFINKIPEFVQEGINWVITLKDNAMKFIEDLGNQIGEFVGQGVDALGSAFDLAGEVKNKVVDATVAMFTSAISGLTNAFDTIILTIAEWLDNLPGVGSIVDNPLAGKADEIRKKREAELQKEIDSQNSPVGSVVVDTQIARLNERTNGAPQNNTVVQDNSVRNQQTTKQITTPDTSTRNRDDTLRGGIRTDRDLVPLYE